MTLGHAYATSYCVCVHCHHDALWLERPGPGVLANFKHVAIAAVTFRIQSQSNNIKLSVKRPKPYATLLSLSACLDVMRHRAVRLRHICIPTAAQSTNQHCTVAFQASAPCSATHEIWLIEFFVLGSC